MNGQGQRVLEKRILKGICGSKRKELTGGWRKLRNEEFQILYCSLHP
jgi:hypothetical protein